MYSYVGVIRKGDELRRAVDELERIDRKAQNLFIEEKTFENLGKLLETVNLICVGKMSARAALMRTESRGAHYREDFPKENIKWLKNIVIRFYNGEMMLKKRTVNLAYIKPSEPSNLGINKKENA